MKERNWPDTSTTFAGRFISWQTSAEVSILDSFTFFTSHPARETEASGAADVFDNVRVHTDVIELHGIAVVRVRQTGLVANDSFVNRAGLPNTNSPFRQFSFAVGGPVVIPKVYDGRNKTFFFASSDFNRETNPSTSTLSVPSAREILGDFSRSYNRRGGQQSIYDPLNVWTSGTRLPFPGNVIPKTRINPVGWNISRYYPSPSVRRFSYAAPNYAFNGTYPNRSDHSLFKLDHDFDGRARVSIS